MKSTFGAFAQEKINSVIAQLRILEQKRIGPNDNSEEPILMVDQNVNPKELLTIIKLIGEPVLAGKLLELYYQIFPNHSRNKRTKQQYKHWKQEMERLGLLEDRHD